METLLSGGYIVQQIEENLTYDYLHSSEENLWSILYLTGYLTTAQKEGCKENLKDGEYALQIPNAEVMEIFESTIKKWFDDTAKLENRQKLFDAVWNGNDELLTNEMTRLLRTTISYHDYGEDFYHAFLAGIFAGAGYPVESNKEHGEGRSDVIVYNPREAKVAVFEAKYAKNSAIWTRHAIWHFCRSMKECMQKSLRMTMMRFCAMGFILPETVQGKKKINSSCKMTE